MEWSEGGGKWDNCNSIINKYILKRINLKFHSFFISKEPMKCRNFLKFVMPHIIAVYMYVAAAQ